MTQTIDSSRATASDDGARPAAPAPREKRSWMHLMGMDRYSGVYVWALLVVIFGIIETDTFLSVLTFKTVLANEAITGLLTLGLMMALAAGVFDLSLAGTMTMSIVVVAWLQTEHGMNPVLAVLATLLVGAVIGALNAFIIVRLRVHSLIATMGVGSIVGALAYGIAGGRSIVNGIPDSFKNIGRWQPFGIAVPVIYLGVIALVMWIILEFKPVGRHIYATGGNEEAARLTGIRTARLQVGVLVGGAMLAALTGVVFTARMGSASLDAGAPYMMPAFAAAFLGSTQVIPGRFNVRGTLVAIFLIATGTKGLSLHWSNIPWVRPFFEGVALVLAVAIAAQAARRRNGVGVVAIPSHE